jgi:hypothetical protein
LCIRVVSVCVVLCNSKKSFFPLPFISSTSAGHYPTVSSSASADNCFVATSPARPPSPLSSCLPFLTQTSRHIPAAHPTMPDRRHYHVALPPSPIESSPMPVLYMLPLDPLPFMVQGPMKHLEPQIPWNPIPKATPSTTTDTPHPHHDYLPPIRRAP